jgi:hypothetical protein
MFANGTGDCEDCAIAKFVALRLADISSGNLRIVTMRDSIRGEDDAVAAARLDGHWLMLDNRRMVMVEDAYVRNYRPLFVIDQYGLMQYVVAPLLAAALDRERSAAPKLAVEPGLDLILQLGIRIGTGCGESRFADRPAQKN